MFVAKPDDYECSQENSVIPLMRSSALVENNITSVVTFLIKDSISNREYTLSCLGTLAAITIFGVVFTGIVFLFNRFGTISNRIEDSEYQYDWFCNVNQKRHYLLAVVVDNSIIPLTVEEKTRIVLTRDVTVSTFARYPKRIEQRSFNYLSHTASIALFYSIPVIQLVVTYQRVSSFHYT